MAEHRRHVILGTAGHIDHGKTELVRALTGVDTDRLAEEKERGITIELGFTRLDLPTGDSVGIIDVPGHEKFIKTMLAGVAGIDLVMLVVAADEGVMPQTREHMDIIDLLGIDQGVVALTKTDLVVQEEMELAHDDCLELLEGTGLEGAAIVPVSSITGDGIDDLVRELGRLVAGVEERSHAGHARLPIDRVFTLTGHGTIVTGTLWSGTVSPGDKLEVYPAGLPTRIRSVHVHDKPVERAEAGQRTALGLHGVSKDEVTRGDTVGAPRVLHTTHMIDARLRLVDDAKPIKNRTRVHLNIGTSEVLARIILLEGGGLAAGKDALVQMRLESAVLAEKDDLFVIRSYSPVRTMGGGRVIDPIPRRHKRAHEDVLDALGVLESGGYDEVLLHVIGESGLDGISEKKLGQKVDDALLSSVEELLADGRVRKIAGRLLTAEGYSALRDAIEQLLKVQAADSPLEWGMSAEELRGKLGRDLERSVLDAALGELVDSRDVSRRGDLVRWGEEEVALSPAQQKLATAIESLLLKADALPPTLEVLRDEVEEELGAAFRESEFDAIVKLLTSEGRMVKVTSTLFFHPGVVERIRRQVLHHFEVERELGVSSFKDMAGLTRKYAIPLLEFFDSEGITLRSGNVRLKGRKA